MIDHMETHADHTTNRGRRVLYGVLVIVAVLLVPLIAMQFTDEVSWNIADFVTAGVLLLGIGFVYEFVLRNIAQKGPRILAGLAIAAVFTLLWLELAVGIFGTPLGGS